MRKILGLACLLGFGLFLVSAQSHNYFWGAPSRNDTLILREFINQKSSWFKTTKDELVFPKRVCTK